MSQETSKPAAIATHFAVGVSSIENAAALFEELFGLVRIKQHGAGEDLMEAIFGIREQVTMLGYGAGEAGIEVMVSPGHAGSKGYGHLCLSVPDSEDIARRAADMGFAVIRTAKPDGAKILFIKDLDGNLIEVKDL